jgi:hypothetical protein
MKVKRWRMPDTEGARVPETVVDATTSQVAARLFYTLTIAAGDQLLPY